MNCMQFFRKMLILTLIANALLLATVPASRSYGQGGQTLQFDFQLYESNPVVPAARENNAAFDRQFAFGSSVLERGGVYYMFYTGYSGTLSTGAINIGLATSRDGYRWTKSSANPLLKQPDIVQQTSFPRIFVDDSGQWVMLFNNVSLNTGRPSSTIFRATARGPEGPWTVDAEPVIRSASGRWDSNLIVNGIVQGDGEYRLYYTGMNSRYQNAQMGLATSPDGKTWTFYDDPATADAPFNGSDPVLTVGVEGDWDSASITLSNVIVSEAGYEVFFIGYDHDINAQMPPDSPNLWIGYATSEDGIHWTKYANNPVIESNQRDWFHFSAINIDDTYFLYYDEITPNGVGLITGTITPAE